MSLNTESSLKKRFSFLRSKRVIAAISFFVCLAIILLSLGATHVIGSNGSSQQTESDSAATPTSTHASVAASATASTTSKATATATASPGSIAAGTPLRVMCLGASIVLGETSTGAVGFREVLRNNLTSLGVPVNMVGAVQRGDMVDNDVEAYPGNRISQIFDHSKDAVPEQQPNVFVIHVGADNALQNLDVDVAGSQMEDFINYLLDTSPRAFVVLSTLMVNTVPNMEPLILSINAQYRKLITTFSDEGKPVVLAELHPGEGHDDTAPQLADIGPDGTHPLDSGFEKMGSVFAQAIQAADAEGLLQIPISNGIPDDGAA